MKELNNPEKAKINVLHIVRRASRFTVFIPCFMVLATVFVVNRELADGVVSGKYFWFYLSMGVLAGSSVFVVVRSLFNTETRKAQRGAEGESIQVSRSDCLVLLFGLITLPVSYWVNGSEAITKHVLLILLILLYFYFRIAFQTNQSARYWLPVFLMVTGLVEAVWGVRQLYGFTMSRHALFRLTGSFFNPGPYSCYLAVVAPVALYYLLRDWSCTKVGFRLRYGLVYLRWSVSLLTFVCILLVLPAGMSRASWLAGIGGCGVVLFFYSAQRYRGRGGAQRKILTYVISAVILAGCVGMYFLKKDSADGRAFIWKNAIQTIAQHPLGVGIGNFSGSYGDTQAVYFASGKGTEREELVAGNPDYAFNEYLQICIEHGIIPFILFSGIAGFSLYIGFKQKRIAPTASLAALLIVAALSYPFSVLPFLIVLVFLSAWIHSENPANIGVKEDREKDKGRIKRLHLLWSYDFTVLLLSAVLVYTCIYNRYPAYEAYRQWRSYTSFPAGVHGDVTEAYRRMYPYLSDQIKFLFEYAQHLSKSGQYEESNQVLEKAVRISCDPMLYNVMGNNYKGMGEYGKAENMYLRASQIVPHRLYPFYLLAKLYMETGDSVKAKEMAWLVQTKEPKVQSTAVREMRNETQKILQDE